MVCGSFNALFVGNRKSRIIHDRVVDAPDMISERFCHAFLFVSFQVLFTSFILASNDVEGLLFPICRRRRSWGLFTRRAKEHVYHGSSGLHLSSVKDSSIPESPDFETKVSVSPQYNLSEDIINVNDESSALTTIKDRKFLERINHWIIFIDDEESIRQSVGDFLYDSGYQVTACADAMAFVEVCRAAMQHGLPVNADSVEATEGPPPVHKLPSCIVSDIRMPGGPDGLELLQWIRSSDVIKRVPVVLLTAKALTKDRIVGYKAGADAYLPKPFYPEELLSVIDTLILRRQQMTGTAGALVDIQQEMANVKLLLKQNAQRTVKQTDVYLTPASREILNLLCQGYTNSEIAEMRGTSKNYVSKVLKRIYDETGTSTRTELLRWAIQTGYVNPKM
jgi:DNA-binding NarL/FixJ family response regulator